MSVFVKSIFAKGSSTLFKVGQFETLYACAGAREVILDVVPHVHSTLFIKSFRCRTTYPFNLVHKKF